VYINGPDGRGFWQQCWVDERKKVNWCRTWNVVGDVFYDEPFLRYSGDPSPVPAEQLHIAHEGGPKPAGLRLKGGPDYVVLENGEILLPQSESEEKKLFY
jgi:hypothetical protein